VKTRLVRTYAFCTTVVRTNFFEPKFPKSNGFRTNAAWTKVAAALADLSLFVIKNKKFEVIDESQKRRRF
jgi:hypothetical protein